ncbi:hypothetical protein ACJX0J_038400, partial [Zea mays]
MRNQNIIDLIPSSTTVHRVLQKAPTQITAGFFKQFGLYIIFFMVAGAGNNSTGTSDLAMHAKEKELMLLS